MSKQDRLKQISISAAKQCGRSSIVDCNSQIISIKDVINLIPDYDVFFVAYENESGKTLTDYLISNNKDIKKVAIMIGSEGGFSETEIDQLNNAGAVIVSLGNRILRTETASIACTAILTQLLKA